MKPRNTHSEVVAKLMSRPRVRAELERIEREEGELLNALLEARQDAGLTQARAIARLEHSLATGKHSPSIATLRTYVQACGRDLHSRIT
jgi:hypothetical protein